MAVPATPPQTLNVKLLPDEEIGVFADFAAVWHTPNTFILDFITVIQPQMMGQDENGQPVIVLPARVASRVRMPPEQVFRLAEALQTQAQQWMAETNRGEIPPAWVPPDPPPPGDSQPPAS